MDVKIKVIDNGKLPTYGRDGDACLDCYANPAEDFVKIPPKTRCLIKLGFALELPVGYEAVIRPRSGNTKRGTDIGIGTIDSNYRGECMACVINNASGDLVVKRGDRICQLAIRKTESINWIECDELSDTERGDKGFGSSGY